MTAPIETLIAGQWRHASGPEYTTEYPHDGSTVASLHAATAADVDEAVQAAEVARHRSNWAGLKRHERAGILHRIATGIRERGEELAQLQRLDNGKPIKETRALVASAAGTFQFFAAACETWEDQVTPARGDFLTMSVHEPLGVVGAITPWNSPIASEAQKLAPALAAGCAMVFKPAEITPRMAIELAHIAQKAGVPDGIISVLPGKGSVVGDAIVKHPLIKRIAFTGGTNVGMGIQRLAAEKLMPTSLELGGKSPTIVCADADLDHAVAGVLYGIFSSSGESCIAGSRAFVHASVYDEFKRRLLVGTQKLRVGDPSSEATQMGPLVNMGHRASVERYVQLGLDEGGKVLSVASARKAPCTTKAATTCPPSSKDCPTVRACARKKFLARCWRCCPGATKLTCWPSAMTTSMAWPRASGRATTKPPGGLAARCKLARSGSTRTRCSRSARRLAASN
jgi:betaine-aldehyde dehydrogenase